jgi:hypothetical protein
MVTTAVRRVLTTDQQDLIYVETENSVYRLRIRDVLDAPPVKVRHSGTR